jgi:hypothetical protein
LGYEPGNETSVSAAVNRLLDWLKNSQVSRGALALGQVYVKYFAFEKLPASNTQVI